MAGPNRSKIRPKKIRVLLYQKFKILILRFCDTCDSKLIKTRIGEKCPKCDIEIIKQVESIEKKQDNIPKYTLGQDFPFEKNEYYLQKDIRNSLGCSLMSGINFNKEGNFLVIFMNAHNPKTSQNNPYHDHYDSETGLYHYTGRGRKGDQTLTSVNEYLAASNENNTIIHFFVQRNLGNDHQYVGKVKLEKVIPSIQTDANSKHRKVYVFLLRPID